MIVWRTSDYDSAHSTDEALGITFATFLSVHVSRLSVERMCTGIHYTCIIYRYREFPVDGAATEKWK